jgi:hypothetical protein
MAEPRNFHLSLSTSFSLLYNESLHYGMLSSAVLV